MVETVVPNESIEEDIVIETVLAEESVEEDVDTEMSEENAANNINRYLLIEHVLTDVSNAEKYVSANDGAQYIRNGSRYYVFKFSTNKRDLCLLTTIYVKNVIIRLSIFNLCLIVI